MVYDMASQDVEEQGHRTFFCKVHHAWIQRALGGSTVQSRKPLAVSISPTGAGRGLRLTVASAALVYLYSCRSM